jgi:hypothetical protein
VIERVILRLPLRMKAMKVPFLILDAAHVLYVRQMPNWQDQSS